MADFYRHELSDAVGNAWRIDIYEGSPFARGATPTVLKDDVIGKIEGFTWEYDKYPLGLHAPLTGSIELSADAMPSSLRQWILNPQTTGTPFELSPIGAPGYLNGGNPNYRTFFQFQCQPFGQTGFKTVWYAVVAQESVRPVGGVFKVPLADAFAYALQQLPILDIEVLDAEYLRNTPSDRKVRSVVYDYIYNSSGWRKVAHPAQRSPSSPAHYWATPWTSLFNLWNDYAGIMFSRIVRLDDTVIRTDLWDVLTEHVREKYRQLTTTAAGAGTGLNIDDVYAVPFIMGDTDATAEVLDSLHRTIERNYKTFYDLFVDLVKSSYTQAAIRHYTDAGEDKVSVWYLQPINNGYLAIQKDITELAHDNLEPGFSARLLGTATASNEFAIGEDYDKVDRNTKAGRNKEEYSMPITLVSIPTIPTGSYTKDDANSQEYDWSYARYFGMYYLADPSSIFSEDQLIRCHSYASYRNYGETAPTVPATMGYTLSYGQGKAAAIADQQESGQLQRMASILATTFGDPECAEIMFSALVTDVVSGYTMLPFVPACMSFALDLTDVFAWATGITAPTVWYPTKCTYDLKAATVEIEAWGRP